MLRTIDEEGRDGRMQSSIVRQLESEPGGRVPEAGQMPCEGKGLTTMNSDSFKKPAAPQMALGVRREEGSVGWEELAVQPDAER